MKTAIGLSLLGILSLAVACDETTDAAAPGLESGTTHVDGGAMTNRDSTLRAATSVAASDGTAPGDASPMRAVDGFARYESSSWA